MSRAWLLVALVGLVTVTIKAAGPMLFGLLGPTTRPRLLLQQVVPILMPAILAALIVTQVFSVRERLTFDSRAVGLMVAMLGANRHAPPGVVLIAAAVATALVRLLAR
jgi:hypothetical protein